MASVPTPGDLRVGDGKRQALGKKIFLAGLGGKAARGEQGGLDCKIRWATPFTSQKVGILFRIVHRGSLGRAWLSTAVPGQLYPIQVWAQETGKGLECTGR